MNYCRSCGAELNEGENFCRQCGARVMPPEAASDQTAEQSYQAPAETPAPQSEAAPAVPQVPVYYQPGSQSTPPQGAPVYSSGDKRPDRVLGAWSYVLSIFLLSLPIAGFILQIVWACGATNSLNRRNLARAYLLLTCIVVVLYIIFLVVVLALVGPNLTAIMDEFRDEFYREFGSFSGYRF